MLLIRSGMSILRIIKQGAHVFLLLIALSCTRKVNSHDKIRVKGKCIMVAKSIVVKAETGIHARPASLLVQKATSFPCELKVEKGNKSANLKSIMGVMSLCINKGDEIRVIAEGEREHEAITAITKMIEEME